jgi:hypothetical protein
MAARAHAAECSILLAVRAHPTLRVAIKTASSPGSNVVVQFIRGAKPCTDGKTSGLSVGKRHERLQNERAKTALKTSD